MSTAWNGRHRQVRFARQTAGVTTTVEDLRQLGPEGLADLLTLRPDVVAPVLPLSLHELAARLARPRSAAMAVQRLDTPTLQVVEALVHLGRAGDRGGLVRFLRLDDPAALEALDRCLAVVDAHLLREPGGGLAVDLAHLWRPYGLGPRLADVLREWTVDRLRAALDAWGEPTAGRKADLVTRLATVLADEHRVHQALATGPDDDRRALEAAADGDGVVDLGYVTWDGRVRGQPSWTLLRGLAVRTWEGRILLPAEVTLALRGSGWRPPFEWRFPDIGWTRTHRDLVDRESASAATRTLRLLTALVEELAARPARLNRDGSLGVRERKRLATTLAVDPPHVTFAVALAFAGGLVAHVDETLAATQEGDTWTAAAPADRLAVLLHAWLGMVQVPLASPDGPWTPLPAASWGRRRLVPLEVLSTVVDQAPADRTDLVRACVWLTPEGGPGGGAAVDPVADVEGLLAEAALLGLTGAGALSTLGHAVVSGEDPAQVLQAWAGAASETARLQADLTAVVLGDPSQRLGRVLDLMADRESRDQATTWRFSAASVARALDGGQSAEGLLAALAAVADDAVPQPLAYLVRDTARRHGVLRAAAVACYVRSDDHALLAEVAADSRLRRLGLRLLGPGVLVGDSPLDQTLERLRAAGYLPVQEAGDGVVVAPEREEVRAEVSDYIRGFAAPPASDDDQLITPLDLAQAMLQLPDDAPSPLMEISGTVIDSRSLPELFASFRDDFGM